MIKETEWYALLNRIVDVYGVPSTYSNIESDDELEDEGLWFTCPECEDVVSAEDWDYDEVKYSCPICGYEWEF